MPCTRSVSDNMSLTCSTMSEGQIRTKLVADFTNIHPRKIYRVLLEKGQDGWIVARCRDIKGAISQGKDRDEALRNIIEAISVILEDTGESETEFSITWDENLRK